MNNKFLKKELISYSQINQYLVKATKSILDSQKILLISPEESFKTTYDAMLKITLALMLSHGVRPRTQVGHHITMIKFAQKILGNPADNLIIRFNKMRQRRNKLIYDISAVSKDEAEQAIVLAKRYLNLVKDFLEKKNPQKKLL